MEMELSQKINDAIPEVISKVTESVNRIS